jgi:hypothetical protein
MAYNQTRDNEYLKVKDTSTGQPEPVEGLNGGIKVTDGTTFITTADQTTLASNLGDTSADLGKTYVNYETGEELEWQGTVRGFIVTGTGGAAHVYGLARKASDLAAATTYSATETLGFHVDVVGSTAWSATFVDGGTVSFTPVAGEHYPWHLSSITSGTGGTGVVFIP